MVSLFSAQLLVALRAAFSASFLAVAFLAFLAGGGKAGVKPWLRSRVGLDIEQALLPVLENLWGQAYDAGFREAVGLTGKYLTLDPFAKRELIDQLGREWVSEIAQTRIDQIAEILAAGGTEAELASAIQAVLDDPAGADLIARTEVVRAFSLGATAAYEAAGIPEVLWLTSGDANVCPNCQANESAGPVPLGTPFPSGAIAPPQHPRCRCVLIPA